MIEKFSLCKHSTVIIVWKNVCRHMKQLMESYCFPSIPSKRKEKVQQGSRLLRWMDVQYTRDINSYINSEQNEYHQDNRDWWKKTLINLWEIVERNVFCLIFQHSLSWVRSLTVTIPGTIFNPLYRNQCTFVLPKIEFTTRARGFLYLLTNNVKSKKFNMNFFSRRSLVRLCLCVYL